MSSAILPFLGVIVGAALQYFFTRHLDNQKHHRDLKTKAYTDYLKCVSELASIGGEAKPQERRELLANAADAKTRICLYGSSSAVGAFAEFERLGATMNSADQRDAFTRMVAIMRNDSSGGRKVELKDLETVLLGNDRPCA
jgi:hypothetical protein